MEIACGHRVRDCGSQSACAAPRGRVRLPERACGHKNSVPIFWLDQKGLYIHHLIKHGNGLWSSCARLRLPERMCDSLSARAASRECVRLPERACGHKNNVPIFWLDQKELYIRHLIILYLVLYISLQQTCTPSVSELLHAFRCAV